MGRDVQFLGYELPIETPVGNQGQYSDEAAQANDVWPDNLVAALRSDPPPLRLAWAR